MAKKFTQLRAGMSPAAQKRSNEKASEMLADMPLHELRQARGLSQKMLADVLHVQPPSFNHRVAKLTMPVQLQPGENQAGSVVESIAKSGEALTRYIQ